MGVVLLLVPVIPVWNVEDPSSNYCDRNVLGRSLNCSEVQEKANRPALSFW
jgi:hypothetical protein